MTQDDQKRAVGEAAAARVQDGMTVGLGSGSTAAFFVSALGRRVREEGLSLRGVATSEATARQAQKEGITLLDLNAVAETGDRPGIDLTVDGADEITPGLAVIKGGGAALTREKLVWEASKRCLAIVDAGKVVERLGAFPLPIEVVAFGHATTARRIARAAAHAGVHAHPRLRLKAGAPLVTDNGGLIYDLPCGEIPDPLALALALKPLTGVVEHGLFPGLADEALVATPEGVRVLRAGEAPSKP